MNNNDRTAQGNGSRSFAQEMQQAVTEWVRKLPFMKRKIHEGADRESSDEASTARASAARPAGTVPAGERLENDGGPGSAS